MVVDFAYEEQLGNSKIVRVVLSCSLFSIKRILQNEFYDLYNNNNLPDTLTTNEQIAVFPALSRILYVTNVDPTSKNIPDS